MKPKDILIGTVLVILMMTGLSFVFGLILDERAAFAATGIQVALTTTIPDTPVPLTSVLSESSSWAVFNLILMVVGIVVAIVLYLSCFIRFISKPQHKGQASTHIIYEKTHLWCVLVLVIALLSMVTYLLSEDMSLPMTFLDAWSLPMVGLAVAQGLCVIAVIKENQIKEEAQKKSQRFENSQPVIDN